MDSPGVRALGLDEVAGGARAEGRGSAAGGGLPRPRHRCRRQPQHLPVPRESLPHPLASCYPTLSIQSARDPSPLNRRRV